ncbi:hypothetical protein OFC08_30615, partial [Escherichia coli]|nr:hypothetical protein [Escherichia coli]
MTVGTTLNLIWEDEIEERVARGKPFWEIILLRLDMMAMDRMVHYCLYQVVTEWALEIHLNLLLI